MDWLTASAKLPQHIHSNTDQTAEKQVNYGRVTCFNPKNSAANFISPDPN